MHVIHLIILLPANLVVLYLVNIIQVYNFLELLTLSSMRSSVTASKSQPNKPHPKHSLTPYASDKDKLTVCTFTSARTLRNVKKSVTTASNSLECVSTKFAYTSSTGFMIENGWFSVNIMCMRVVVQRLRCFFFLEFLCGPDSVFCCCFKLWLWGTGAPQMVVLPRRRHPLLMGLTWKPCPEQLGNR